MHCFKCGNTLPDNSLFCQFCGANLNEQNVCTACGAPMEEGGSFCSHCGQQRENAAAPVKRKSASTALRIAAILLPIAILIAALILLINPLSNLHPVKKEEPTAFSPAEAARSVLYLECYDSTGDLLGNGSGFLIEDGKTLVTNHHVMNGAYSIAAFDADGKYLADVLQVLFSHKEKDLAVLELNCDTGLPPLPLGDSELLKQGDSIYAIGYPLGMTNTVSDGIISSFYNEKYADILQITAAISPGSSGGALMDSSGNVVGVIRSRIIDGENMNLAVSVNDLKTLLKSHRVPVGTDELYIRTHPQVQYDDYEVRIAILSMPSEEIAEEYYAFWNNTDRTKQDLQDLVETYEEVYGCVYSDDIEPFSRDDFGSEDRENWFFDVDRSYGDAYMIEYEGEIYLLLFLEAREIKAETPVAETPIDVPVKEEPAKEAAEEPAEKPAEVPGCTHIWSMIAVKQVPNCTQEGQATVHCTLCRAWEHRTLAALGHSYTSGICIRCDAMQPVYVPPVQDTSPATEVPATEPPAAEPPAEEPSTETPALTKELLLGTWVCNDIDGIYGRSQQYVFNGNNFYFTFWKGGITEGGSDAVEERSNGTYTIDGNNVYLSNGLVGTINGKYLYIGNLVFYKPY